MSGFVVMGHGKTFRNGGLASLVVDTDPEVIWRQMELFHEPLLSELASYFEAGEGVNQLQTHAPVRVDALVLADESDDSAPSDAGENQDGMDDGQPENIIGPGGAAAGSMDSEQGAEGDDQEEQDEDGSGFPEGDGEAADDLDEAALEALYGVGGFDPDHDKMEDGEDDEEAEEDEDDLGMDDHDGFDDGDGAMEGDVDGPEEMTALGRQLLAMEDRTKAAEEGMLDASHWTMKGQVPASNRAKDSLIEEFLETEHAMRPKPTITPETTAKLESMIKQRIIDGMFDDVVRRTPLTEADDLAVTNPASAEDSTRQRQSLVDIYEKEFLDKQRQAEIDGGGEVELTQEQKEEIKAINMWKETASLLDSLSNFHFTPIGTNNPGYHAQSHK
eukprot:gene2898-3485_t